MAGKNHCSGCGDRIPDDWDMCRDCQTEADVKERVGSPDVAVDGSISGEKTAAESDSVRSRSIPMPSLLGIWLRVRSIPSLIAMATSLVLSFVGIYVAIIGSQSKGIAHVDVHGFVIGPLSVGEIQLNGWEVVIVAGVLVLMTGLTIMYRLSAPPTGYGVES